MNKEISIRNAVGGDGVRIWDLIKTHGGLDLNSVYCYMMICHHYGNSCYIAESDNKLAGFVTSYYLPEHLETLFVWQIGVNPEMRGCGVASQLLDSIVKKHPNVNEINTTIEPGNTASITLFSSFAKRNDFSLDSKKFIRKEDFPVSAPHADEDLFILKRNTKID
ncbi:MAG: diaminobutyrate acetyltransferase [Lentisphaeraceae bacterium]|nr:diaminobutyrate acetyltransferase [Lentisphaeraceae bacterium]